MFQIRVDCVLSKPVEAVFAAITDHANYKHFPGIKDSKLLSAGTFEKNGQDARREIIASPFRFVERITRYEKPLAMGYVIEELHPFPIRHDRGEIMLEPIADKTRVLWISEGHLLVPMVGGVLDKLIEPQITKAFKAILLHIEAS